jgi:hypothetical protein
MRLRQDRETRPHGSLWLLAFFEWKVQVNTLTTQARNFRPKAGKIAIAVALASAMGGLGMTPAFGDEHDNGGHDAKDRGHNTAPARHNYRPQTQHPSHYARQPVYYAPAPAYYAPRPSPGITLFIPIDIR